MADGRYLVYRLANPARGLFPVLMTMRAIPPEHGQSSVEKTRRGLGRYPRAESQRQPHERSRKSCVQCFRNYKPKPFPAAREPRVVVVVVPVSNAPGRSPLNGADSNNKTRSSNCLSWDSSRAPSRRDMCLRADGALGQRPGRRRTYLCQTMLIPVLAFASYAKESVSTCPTRGRGTGTALLEKQRHPGNSSWISQKFLRTFLCRDLGIEKLEAAAKAPNGGRSRSAFAKGVASTLSRNRLQKGW